jgi:hypothetical protein
MPGPSAGFFSRRRFMDRFMIEMLFAEAEWRSRKKLARPKPIPATYAPHPDEPR